jgi:predicted transcriptional regulator
MIEIRNYTQEELEYIKENYNKMTVKEIAEKLNKSVGSISNATRKMGLIKQLHKPWTLYEIEYLKNNYIQKTSEEIGEYLNRSTQSVNAERDRLGLIRNEPWTSEDIDYLINNFESMSHAEIGHALNRTEQADRAKCFDLNLFKKELPWSDYEINFIKDYYMEMKTSDISKILNRTNSAIELKASRMGLKKYPYMCDYHYFDDIDMEEKAYWLGFLTADGWINKNDKNNAGVTGVELQYGDINHLKKFNKSIGGNYQITDRWKSCAISSKDKEKKYHLCCIRIFSLTMYNSLVNQGFTKDKSYDYHIPYLRADLIKHYIRGYFDGDGCLCFTNKSFCINFTTASQMLNNDVANILKSKGFNFSESSYISEFGTVIYRIDINKQQDKINFLDWIYKDANIYLDRKYKKYLKVKNKYTDTQSLAV